MSLAFTHDARPQIIVDWPGLMHELGPGFAARATTHDATDTFVAENFAELKARGALAAAVPGELGGGGAPYPQLCEMLRVLGRYCGSTALTLSMHTHLVATAAWRWRRDPGAVEGLLRRIADERLLLVGSGASDWLTPSGAAERLDNGWRINAQKVFASGIPGGDLFMTQALHAHPETGPTALHFAIPINAAGVEPQDTWRALGMRATGSHHVLLRDVIVPDAAVLLQRPAGRWTPLFHLYAITIPLPLIYAVYLGIAEAARDAGLALARKRPDDPGLAYAIGEMENALAAARMAHRDMVEAAERCDEPGPETTNRIMIGRTLVGRAVTQVAEKAMEAVGGSSFYRAAGLERLFRDVQGARFHRPQERAQLRLSGRLALGFDFDA
jgi:alkylation response protein AidB-like acyl-CoA dehydrogenase